MLCLSSEDSAEYELTYNLDPDEYDEMDLRPLRQLPPGGLTLHYSEQDEDADELTEWLAQPNPHPGPAPLFD